MTDFCEISPCISQTFPRARTVSPGGQSGNFGSECIQGQFSLPQTRSQCSQAVAMIVPPEPLIYDTGFWNILFSLDCRLNWGAPLSIIQFCTRKSVSVSSVPLRSHISISTESFRGRITVPNEIPLGSVQEFSSSPFSLTVQSLFFQPLMIVVPYCRNVSVSEIG